MNIVWCVLFIIIGLFCLIGSILNLEFFFTTRKVNRFVRWFGRTAARIFYSILGIFFICIAIIWAVGQ